jgi:hypothetical protein
VWVFARDEGKGAFGQQARIAVERQREGTARDIDASSVWIAAVALMTGAPR